MKYFVLLLFVALVHCAEDFVPKTRADASLSKQKCLSKLEMSEETFGERTRGPTGDEDLMRSVVKCTAIDLGFAKENEDGTGVFYHDRLVMQFGGEASKATVGKCIEEIPIDTPTFDKSVFSVMQCLVESNMPMYKE